MVFDLGFASSYRYKYKSYNRKKLKVGSKEMSLMELGMNGYLTPNFIYTISFAGL